MAIYGCKHQVFAPIQSYTPGTAPTYGEVVNGVADAGRITKVDLSFEYQDASLDGDNVVAERDNSMKGGSITTGLTHLTNKVRTVALGFVENGSDKDDLIAVADAAPYVGWGCVLNEIIEGVKKYRGIWVYRTQFALGRINAETQGENLNFQTGEISGKMLGCELGSGRVGFYHDKYFDTEEAAIAWVDGKGASA